MKKLFLAGVFFMLVFEAAAQDFSLYEKKIFVDGKDTLVYRILYPEKFRPDKKYPLIMFMHGAGERGDNNTSQLVHGSRMFTNPVNREKYPAIVLFPQCPKELYWSFETRPENGFDPRIFLADAPETKILSSVKELLDSYIENEKVDPKRIYVIGLSMGGMATFDLVCRYPEVFAAAVPICGGVNPDRLAAAKDVKFRIFHGDADDIVPYQNSRNAYRALKEAGADVEYIEFPGVNHGSWGPAFNQPDFMSWIFKQKK